MTARCFPDLPLRDVDVISTRRICSRERSHIGSSRALIDSAKFPQIRASTKASNSTQIPKSSKLCLGTMQYGERLDKMQSFQLLDHAAENGISCFDSAEMYPVPQSRKTQGLSELFLGEWLEGKQREKFTVSTKVAGPSGQMTYIRDGPLALDAHNITEALHGSLKRLKTDYIDLYTLHWPDRYVPMFGETEFDTDRAYSAVGFEEQHQTLAKLQAQGKIREIAISNETPYGLMSFCEVARGAACGHISVLQNAYSLVCRTFDLGLAECCHQEGIGLWAYSPLAMGLLTGKYGAGKTTPKEARLVMYKGRYAEAESRYGPKQNLQQAVDEYCKIAEHAGMPPYELALRFVLGRPLVSAAVIGATSVSQLQELISAAENGRLTPDVLDAIDCVHQRYPSPAP